MSILHELAQVGQAVWYDYIRRAFIEHGELEALIEQGIRGVTSNPTILEQAIAGSVDYDDELRALVAAGSSVEAIYEALVMRDIGRAADLLRPVYEQTGGVDGYVSLEVSPALAENTQGTVAEARRLFAALARPNVMIKVPATPAGIPAITTLIGEGINVNVTLIFSLAQYEDVADAYLSGLETRAATGGDLSRVSSVASFFISRVDTAVDRLLEIKATAEERAAMRGKTAIANAAVAYARFRELYAEDLARVGARTRWERLRLCGARVQRPLWASTGTKNPLYPDTLYVDGLIAPHTVNTVPPATLRALLDHGTATPTLEHNIAAARAHLERLAALGIDLAGITQQLQDEGVAAFQSSFKTLMASIAGKRERLIHERGKEYDASLGGYRAAVDAALAELRDNGIIARVWAHDHTLWKPEPSEIANRLGWLHSPDVMVEQLQSIAALVDGIRADGYTHALLLGMGGSSLAPEVFRNAFGVRQGYLDLAVLDSTDPGAVGVYAERLDPARTLYIVSTKSGGTVETFSFFRFFYNRVVDAVGRDRAGAHFIAITDPGSALAETAQQYRFRTTLLNDPNIGGRYSALSFFGLAPAALIGVDVAAVLGRAARMASTAESCNCPVAGNNSAAWLGAIMGELAAAGRDKLTVVASPPLAGFGVWVEQLIAESTGKQGTGILPVADEPLGPATVYGQDRLFVYLRLDGDTTHDAALRALEAAGHPVVRLRLRDRLDLGGEFFRWQMATALAGRRLGINPFDQPNVESAKQLARRMVATYHQDGSLPAPTPSLQADGIRVYADTGGTSLPDAAAAFLAQARPRDYVALHAYIQPTAAAASALEQLRVGLRDRLGLATTTGFGPRFLHSTGQLHKGDGGNGLFIQITADDPHDIPIPDRAGSSASTMTFGVLKAAQALGDRAALQAAGRRVIGFHLGQDVAAGLARLLHAFADVKS